MVFTFQTTRVGSGQNHVLSVCNNINSMMRFHKLGVYHHIQSLCPVKLRGAAGFNLRKHKVSVQISYKGSIEEKQMSPVVGSVLGLSFSFKSVWRNVSFDEFVARPVYLLTEPSTRTTASGPTVDPNPEDWKRTAADSVLRTSARFHTLLMIEFILMLINIVISFAVLVQYTRVRRSHHHARS